MVGNNHHNSQEIYFHYPFRDNLFGSNPHNDSNETKKIALRFLAQPFQLVEAFEIVESEFKNSHSFLFNRKSNIIERRLK